MPAWTASPDAYQRAARSRSRGRRCYRLTIGFCLAREASPVGSRVTPHGSSRTEQGASSDPRTAASFRDPHVGKWDEKQASGCDPGKCSTKAPCRSHRDAPRAHRPRTRRDRHRARAVRPMRCSGRAVASVDEAIVGMSPVGVRDRRPRCAARGCGSHTLGGLSRAGCGREDRCDPSTTGFQQERS